MTARLFRTLLCATGAILGFTSSRADDYPHLKMGNPSKADEAKDNYLMKKEFFALSYNDGKGTPNWVSWRLVKDDFLTSEPGYHESSNFSPTFPKHTLPFLNRFFGKAAGERL